MLSPFTFLAQGGFRGRAHLGQILAGGVPHLQVVARPGGWNLVGRTPLQLVDVADGYFPLRTGDRVRFEPIGEAEFRRLLGRRL